MAMSTSSLTSGCLGPHLRHFGGPLGEIQLVQMLGGREKGSLRCQRPHRCNRKERGGFYVLQLTEDRKLSTLGPDVAFFRSILVFENG